MPQAPRTAADGISRWKSPTERREVNEALDRNATWREIASICARHGRKNVTSANVTNYRKSSDRRLWQQKTERLEAIRRESDVTAAVIRHYAQNGGSPAEAGLLAAAEVLTKALAGITPGTIEDMIAEDPKKFLTAIDSLAKMTAYVQRERTTQAKEPPPEEKPLDPTERNRRLKEIFGLPE